MTTVFDNHGIRFEYPPDWELEVDDEGPLATISVHAPGGLAFGMVTLDDDRPDPDDLVAEALTAMRDEYPGLDASPTRDTIAGHPAIGHNLEFLSLDLTNSCAIRCFRTPRRTVLVFHQWSDLGGDEAEAQLLAIRGSLEETDADD